MDPAKRWRPKDRSGGVCGYTFDDKACRKRGAHYCVPRADRVVKFCSEVLRHTAGPYVRRPFVLDDWQDLEIVRPLFGEVVWSSEWGRYVRRYQVAYIVMARKNGKSALAAALVLYLLTADEEESAEVYGAAKNTRQAGKVYEPVKKMRAMSPLLARTLAENKNARRIYHERSGSWYEVIPADALSELGHNPHGFVLDEVLSQPDSTLWDALRTAEGARTQPLFIAITTETNEPDSFGASLIDDAERIQADPASMPHVFAWCRKTPADADPFDESKWHIANPALGSFKSLESMRRMALEARDDPVKLEAFKQYQLNIRVSAVTRWFPLGLFGRATGGPIDEATLRNRRCYAGLDLASTTDLAAWVLRFPPTATKPGVVLWRFWAPEAQIPTLDRHTGGLASAWVRDGLLVATEGDWIDYEGDEATGRSGTGLAIHPQIAADLARFRVLCVGYDQWQAVATAQFIQKALRDPDRVRPVPQGYGQSEALQEIFRMVKHDAAVGDPAEMLLGPGGHPVGRWCAESSEVRRDDQDRIKLVKPDRAASSKRVDGMAALANAVKVELDHTEKRPKEVTLW